VLVILVAAVAVSRILVERWMLKRPLGALASAGSGLEWLRRMAVAYNELGYVPPLWIGTIFVGVLLSAYIAREIGIAAIFGAFVMGLIMPRHAGLTDDVSRRLEDFVTTVLLLSSSSSPVSRPTWARSTAGNSGWCACC
jgi:Kef-type K+ transport system membrane component KefB